MKQKYLWTTALVLLMLLPKEKTHAQECTHCCTTLPTSTCLEDKTAEVPAQVIIDFKTKQIAFEDKYLRPNRPVQIRIKNINPALYKIEINGKDSTIPTPITGKMSAFFLDPSGLSSIAENLLSVVGALPPISRAEANSFSDNVSKINAASQPEMRIAVDMEIREVTQAPQRCDDSCVVKKMLELETTLVDDLQTRITATFTVINQDLYTYRRAFSALRKLYPDCNNFSPTALADINSRLTTHRKTLKDLTTDVAKHQKAYSIARSVYQKYLTEHKSGEEGVADSLIRKFYSEAASSLTVSASGISLDKEDELLTQAENMALFESCYTSLPQFLLSDAKKFKIDINPRIDSLGLPSYSTEFNLPWMQHSVFGVGAGVHIDGLVNQNPVVISDSTTATGRTYRIAEDEGSKIGLGINTQAYFAWNISKKNKPFFIGLSFGAGLSIETKPKSRFLLGLVGVAGEQKRLIISAGLIAGHVSTLSEQYKDKQFTVLPKDFTRDIIKGSVFFSLSYHLLGKQ